LKGLGWAFNAQKEPTAARELILGSPEQVAARFPKLDDSQIAALARFGQQRDAQPHEVILERGDLHHGIFVVLSVRVEVIRVSADGETVLPVLDRGEFTGDVNLLSGRGTLIRARALKPASCWKSTGPICATLCRPMPRSGRYF
jgi:thioredoxin reductase (NADPH)